MKLKRLVLLCSVVGVVVCLSVSLGTVGCNKKTERCTVRYEVSAGPGITHLDTINWCVGQDQMDYEYDQALPWWIGYVYGSEYSENRQVCISAYFTNNGPGSQSVTAVILAEGVTVASKIEAFPVGSGNLWVSGDISDKLGVVAPR